VGQVDTRPKTVYAAIWRGVRRPQGVSLMGDSTPILDHTRWQSCGRYRAGDRHGQQGWGTRLLTGKRTMGERTGARSMSMRDHLGIRRPRTGEGLGKNRPPKLAFLTCHGETRDDARGTSTQPHPDRRSSPRRSTLRSTS